MRHLATAAALALMLTAPAAAQWPTTEWTILDESVPDEVIGFGAPVGERASLGAKHERILEASSVWFSRLGFVRPLQETIDTNLEVTPGEPYVAFMKAATVEISSSHSTRGRMRLTSNPGFLAIDTPLWDLMEASAVHEVYHGIQRALSPSLVPYQESRPETNPSCPQDTDLDWLFEGTAGMIQIRWLEAQGGFRYGHPFHGSSRPAWVREFDQSLVRGALPSAFLDPSFEKDPMRRVSWLCDYGTWYFWYAVGDMLARTEAEKLTYTQFLFNAVEPWADGGVANADIGLKAAARQYEAIEPYRGGLYDLYPEFVAQYLTDDRFYGDLETVELAAPGLFETTSSLTGGPLEPLASRAWRVDVDLPADPGTTPIPYTVRFTLDAPDGTDRDALHLIVGENVAGRPALDETPYTAVVRTDDLPREADGTVSLLVRVANVAEEAADTEPGAFSLRVEVDGFYGEDVSDDGLAAAAGGELPPGFAVNGPGPWACRGGADARAVFDLMTPDELGQDIDRALPEVAQDMEDMMDDMEIAMRRAQQMGRATGMTPEQMAELREQARAAFEQAEAEHGAEIDRAADEVRAEPNTLLGATFVGSEAGEDCQMTLGATLLGREGGAQIIPGAVDPDRYPDGEAPDFGVMVYPRAVLDLMQGMGAAMAGARPGEVPASLATMDDPMDGWQVCTMTDEERRRARESAGDCPPVLCTTGRLVLEAAEQGRIAGSFQFEVLRWPERQTGRCRVPSGRDTVTGHFNVASTDDGTDDNSLGGIGLGSGLSGGVPIVPGAPVLDWDLDD